MPLEEGSSKEAVSHNISAEEHAGKPHKQAIATSLAMSRRIKGMAHSKVEVDAKEE